MSRGAQHLACRVTLLLSTTRRPPPTPRASPPGVRPSPLTDNIATWEYELAELRAWLIAQPGSCFEDLTLEKLENETAFILEGLRHGFIVADTFPPPYEESYPVSAENETIITADLAEERSSGRIFPALSKPQWVTPHFVKIEGTPLKPKYRIIRDFTVVRAHGDPDFASVNDVAWHDTFKMSSVDDAFASMKPNAFMAKVDISKAYRAVPVHPSQWELLSYKWHGVYYSDTRLPFGLRNAPEIFCRLTAMVRFFMIRRGHMAVVYVDDFFNTHITMANCQAAYDCLLLLLRSLGFTVNEDKCTPPCKDLIFLGVRLQTDASSDNSGAMVASVPPTKLTEILELIARCRPFKVIPTRQWQRLMGRLNFISRVIYGARPYSRRLFDALRDALRANRNVVLLTEDVNRDLDFWTNFARTFNGRAVILAAPVLHPAFFATDACDNGIGGFFDGATFGGTFGQLEDIAGPGHLKHRDLWPPPFLAGPGGKPTLPSIGYKELFAVWWACVLWGPSWGGLTIIVHVDNEGAEGMLNSGTCRSHNPAYQKLLRRIFWLSALGCFRLRATRITTEDNVLADRLSRGTHAAPDYHAAFRAWKLRAATLPRCLPRGHLLRLHALERLYAGNLPKHGRALLSIEQASSMDTRS